VRFSRKTDLTHAQQEGYSLEAIADGLCRGLAGNLLDVLLDGHPPAEPLVFCGGVSRNTAVARHIADLTGITPVVDEDSPLYGALGAAWEAAEQELAEAESRNNPDDILAVPVDIDRTEGFHYPPLVLKRSSYPDFSCIDSWEVPVEGRKGRYPVEVEVFEEMPSEGSTVLGIDIGSTSTKAVLVDEDGSVLIGLYTRTAGRPVEAAKGVLMALEGALEKYDSRIDVTSCATTGSGRKLIGEIFGAELILDEITAHARAAVELDPDVDTIIEIGGQDSKFTTLAEGRVTGSVMNNVCAAGTGSFLEEQAARLGCVVTDYASRTEGVSAPLTSDRCTVFMQRDLNHLMSEGHSVEEVLASALHSVRENYLNKVAVRSRIGKKVFFQGATARIKTLVAAFEQAIGQPIIVSRYCRHTGALGAALQLMDEGVKAPRFRGTSLWKTEIPVHTEVCSLCRNACKITVAEVAGEKVAYGFLCGRDYETDRYVAKAGEAADPLSERRKIFRIPPVTPAGAGVHWTLGLPAALYLSGELPFWEKLFSILGIPTVTDRSTDPIESGKALTGAEFCAPMTALHGRVARLLKEADYVFVPFYLDEKGPQGDTRSYCYYSQFAPAPHQTDCRREAHPDSCRENRLERKPRPIRAPRSALGTTRPDTRHQAHRCGLGRGQRMVRCPPGGTPPIPRRPRQGRRHQRRTPGPSLRRGRRLHEQGYSASVRRNRRTCVRHGHVPGCRRRRAALELCGKNHGHRRTDRHDSRHLSRPGHQFHVLPGLFCRALCQGTPGEKRQALPHPGTRRTRLQRRLRHQG
jgi:predicted CoA-substrate-specific enzyme activase